MVVHDDMFSTVMRQSGLCQNEIENFIFEIAQKNNTDDHNVIADAFVLLHCKTAGVAGGAALEDLSSAAIEGFCGENKNFLHGCTDLETQRVVRRRKSDNIRSATPSGCGVEGRAGGKKERDPNLHHGISNHQVI